MRTLGVPWRTMATQDVLRNPGESTGVQRSPGGSGVAPKNQSHPSGWGGSEEAGKHRLELGPWDTRTR